MTRTHLSLTVASGLTAFFLMACSGGDGSDSAGDSNGNNIAPTDSSPPSITVTAPVAGTAVSGLSSIALTGTVTDDVELTRLALSSNEAAPVDLTIQADGTFTNEVMLTKQENRYVLTAYDAAGNFSTAEFRVTRQAAGKLDTSFGPDVNPIDGSPDGFSAHLPATYNIFAGLAADQSGNLYVTGTGIDQSGSPAANWDLMVGKLDASGLVATDFGTAGWTRIDNPTNTPTGGSFNGDYAREIAIDSEGRVLLAGITSRPSGNAIILARVNPNDGQMDSTFGDDAYPADGTPDGFFAITITNGASHSVRGLHLTADDKIVLIGSSDHEFILRRNADGTPDTSFGQSDGHVPYNSTGGLYGNIRASMMDSSGRFLIAGNFDDTMRVWRLNPDGSADLTFGSDRDPVDGVPDGFISFESPGDETSADALAIDAQQRLIVAGSLSYESTDGTTDMIVWRYTPDGQDDTEFSASTGYVTHDGASGGVRSYDEASAVTVNAAGRILVAGYSRAQPTATTSANLVVWRLMTDGTLDTEFGGDENPADGIADGFFKHHGSAGVNGSDSADSILIDSVGNLVVGGFGFPNGSSDSALSVWRIR